MDLINFAKLLRRTNIVLGSEPIVDFETNYNNATSNHQNVPWFLKTMESIFVSVKENVDLEEFNEAELTTLESVGVRFISLLKYIKVTSTNKEAYKNATENLRNALVVSREIVGKLNTHFALLAESEAPSNQPNSDHCNLNFIFDQKVAIDSIVELKKQSNDVYIIFYGYARILEIPMEDIQVKKAAKNSPFSLDFNSVAKLAALILAVSKGIFEIIKSVAETYELYNKIKSNKVTQQIADLQKHLEDSQNRIKELTDKSIDALVEKKVKELSFDKPVDSEAFSASVNHHYKFIVNGGTINIEIPAPDAQIEIQSYHEEQKELEILRNKGLVKMIEEKGDKE